MNPIRLSEIREVLQADLLDESADLQARVGMVFTDTRQDAPQSLFIAITGGNFDGHNFLAEAKAKGAVAALVERRPEKVPDDFQLLKVKSTRQAMGLLARLVRMQLRGRVIAVAGSNGKTGTKRLIDAALSGSRKGTFSPKSFNNDIGVPLTIFPADVNDDYLVLEIGTNHPGEIRTLAEIALPDIAVITNCFAEHLEFLGDVAGVRRENADIIEGMHDNSWLIVNGDDPRVLEAVGRWPRERTTTFGLEEGNDLFATDIRCDSRGVSYKLNGRREVFVPLLGRHNACNSLAALAVARRMNVDEANAIESLCSAKNAEMRLEFKQVNGIDLLNDAYNANPASMKAALETLSLLDARHRRVAVMGDMRELGPTSDDLHSDVGAFAANLKIDVMICVGEKAKLIGHSALAAGFKGRVTCFAEVGEARREVMKEVSQGDLVLLKGSRAMQLEKISDELAQMQV